MKDLARAAVRALAQFETDGLVELAEICETLRRAMPDAPLEERVAFAAEARDALQPMRNFACVLEATAANLDVLANLSDLHSGRLEYSCRRPRE